MNVIIPGAGPHIFKVLPRYNTAALMAGFTCTLSNENTNTLVTLSNLTNIGFDAGGFFNFNFTTSATAIKEGAFFILTLKKSGAIVYRGRVFATAQTPTAYSVNNNVYQFAPSTGNQFVVL